MTAKRPGALATRQPRCSVCALSPVAMKGVAFCFTCWPGGPVGTPPCLRCGSRRDYYTSGLCRRCHLDGNPGVDTCLDCYAWGASRKFHWRCHGCATFRRENPDVGICRICAREQPLGAWKTCRLCFVQARYVRSQHGDDRLDVVAANRHGQQLFLADLFVRRGQSRDPQQLADAEQHPLTPPDHEQLVLFYARRDLAAHGRAGLLQRADPISAARLDEYTRAAALELGWSARQTDDTYDGIRIVLGIRDHTAEPVRASHVELLRDVDLPAWTVMRVLSEAGMLLEDRTPAFDAWFANQLTGLPEPMTTELRTWFDIMKNGSPTTPRRRPRTETTIRLHTQWALPILHQWANAGHTSLREISREHVLDALPPSGNPRSQAGQGLRSIFRILKGRKMVFTDPTSRVKIGYHQPGQPLPIDVDLLRAALHSDNPAQAALIALMAFHGLRSGQLQRLRLTDIRDQRLHLDGRVILLAEPVRQRISAYLDHRRQRWPNTTNPHLFVTRRTGSRHQQASLRWIWLTCGRGLSAAAVREDRILDEAHATRGDVRRLADLFGLSIHAGNRYTAAVEHPELRHSD